MSFLGNNRNDFKKQGATNKQFVIHPSPLNNAVINESFQRNLFEIPHSVSADKAIGGCDYVCGNMC